MGGSPEIAGTAANQVGDDVFHRLISAGFAQPYSWKLTLVNNSVVNASSTAGGKIYVYGGMLPLLGQNKGLWAAVLSHEAAHTGRRHQVRLYMQELYNQRMIQYYRARIAAGDKSANWSLIGFATASRIALKKLERDQEHDADQQGMLLMARAGYHPDYVFGLHHLLLMRTGEQSKFSAFFSDHPRWETRDQRSDKIYGDALAEFNRLWPDVASSPGGSPPVVAFLGQPAAKENKATETADVALPIYCRNSEEPVDVVLTFQKDHHPVKAADPQFADKDGNLAFHDKADCLERNETTPVVLHIPASAVSDHDRSISATAYVGSHGELIAGQKTFDVHFPSAKRTAVAHRKEIGIEPVGPTNRTDIAKLSPPDGQTKIDVPVHTETMQTALLSESTNGGSLTARAPLTASNSDEGTLSITSTNEGAEIFVDSIGRGKPPATLKVRAGKHSVQVVLDGHQDWVQEVSVNVGQTINVFADFHPGTPAGAGAQPADATPAKKMVAESPSAPRQSSPEPHTGSTGFLVRQDSPRTQPPNQEEEKKQMAGASSIALDNTGGIGIAAITGAYGVIITDVTPEGPAMEAGLKIGDTVIGLDEKSVKTVQTMEAATNSRTPGSTMKVSYIRNGIAAETTVKVRSRSALKSQM